VAPPILHLVASDHLGVQSIPTLVLFKDGEEVARMVGYMPQPRLLAKIKPFIGAAATA